MLNRETFSPLLIRMWSAAVEMLGKFSLDVPSLMRYRYIVMIDQDSSA